VTRLERFIFRRGELSVVRSIGIAIVCVSVAFVARLVLAPLGPASAFATFYPAVLFSTVVAGRVAGLTAIAFSLVSAWWAFVGPYYEFKWPTSAELLRFGLFTLCNGLMIWLAVKYRQVVFDLQDSEKQRRLLADEVHHRARNIVSVITSLVGQTIKDTELAQTLINRIRVISDAENPLENTGSRETDLRQLLEETVQRIHGPSIVLDGPMVRLGEQQARNLRLVFHEMATNAAKYGALSEPAGRVEIDWSDDGSCLEIFWREHDGPKVAAPRRHNFGSKLIGKMLKDLGAGLNATFAESGYCYQISVPHSGREPADLDMRTSIVPD
jgi:two-component sensor histidine kinase